MSIKALAECDLKQKIVLLRLDLNVPMSAEGAIEDDTRIRRVIPTVHACLDQGAGVIIFSHLGRPKEGEQTSEYSLKPIAKKLTLLLKHPVQFAPSLETIEQIKCQPGQCILVENVRFNMGEKANDDALAKRYAALADVFIMDAFATSHRAQASTSGVAGYMTQKGIGLLMQEELSHLQPLMRDAEQPLVAIVGGSKVSTKLNLLKSLVTQVNTLILGGGIANTFLLAQGHPVGKSLCEPDLVAEAKAIMALAAQHQTVIGLPKDVVVVESFSSDAPAETVAINEVSDTAIIVDIGPAAIADYEQLLKDARTIIWNGPVGIFEWPSADAGTKALASTIAASDAKAVAGGGDTLAVIARYGLADQISYLSTGGGAFLALLEGQSLPALKALEQEKG